MNHKNTISSIPSSPSIPSIPSQSDKSVIFTPGPWKAKKCNPFWYSVYAGYNLVANVGSDGSVFCESDAALIAAAPEMFTALMEVLNWYNAFTPHATGRMFVPDDMIEKVLKAIQKARGEKP